MLPWFSPIKITKTEIYVDTINLRRFLAQTGQVPDPELVGNIEFLLFYDRGGIESRIKIILKSETNMLKDLVRFPRYCYLSEAQYIKLEKDIPQSFNFRHLLPLKLKPTESVNQTLEEISDKLVPTCINQRKNV